MWLGAVSVATSFFAPMAQSHDHLGDCWLPGMVGPNQPFSLPSGRVGFLAMGDEVSGQGFPIVGVGTHRLQDLAERSQAGLSDSRGEPPDEVHGPLPLVGSGLDCQVGEDRLHALQDLVAGHLEVHQQAAAPDGRINLLEALVGDENHLAGKLKTLRQVVGSLGRGKPTERAGLVGIKRALEQCGGGGVEQGAVAVIEHGQATIVLIQLFIERARGGEALYQKEIGIPRQPHCLEGTDDLEGLAQPGRADDDQAGCNPIGHDLDGLGEEVKPHGNRQAWPGRTAAGGWARRLSRSRRSEGRGALAS